MGLENLPKIKGWNEQPVEVAVIRFMTGDVEHTKPLYVLGKTIYQNRLGEEVTEIIVRDELDPKKHSCYTFPININNILHYRTVEELTSD